MKKVEEIAKTIVKECGNDVANGLVEYANLVEQLAIELRAEQIQDTEKIKELLSDNLQNWDEEDWEELRIAIQNKQEKRLKEWKQKEVAITMTNDQWSTLSTYLLMSTNHRKGEKEAWENLAKEKDEEGQPKFKSAANNAEFWKEIIDRIENIIKVIDARNY